MEAQPTTAGEISALPAPVYRPPEQRRGHVRCLGIGVGPANLSLACLLHGHPEVSNLFLERRPESGWHDGQQIPGATLQVSMLKDLVSLADPTNAFSFLSYLHQQGRIYHFINAGFDAVSRREYRDYLCWAGEGNRNVVFGEEVRSVEFRDVFQVRTNRRTLTADNLAIGVGQRAWVPPAGRGWDDSSQFHVSRFVERARNLAGRRVVVVGGGQSGAEAFLDLISRPDAERPRKVTWISRRRNFLPIDDSPFTNDYYMPGHSEYFYGLPPAVRAKFNADCTLTSDGISESTLREIYQRAYTLRFLDGEDQLVSMCPNRTVQEVDRGGGARWQLTVGHNDRPDLRTRVPADTIVWATGFRPSGTEFLGPLAGRMEREGTEFRIDEDFAACWDGPAGHDIFLQNAARGQRGLADPNLSLIAWRSQRIIDRLRGVRSDDQLASFIEWAGVDAARSLRRGA